MVDETPDTPTPETETDDAQAEERAIPRLSTPTEPQREPTPSHSALEKSDPAPSMSDPAVPEPKPEKSVTNEAPTPSHSPLEASDPAPILTDPIHRDKEATGEMRAVKPTLPETLEDDPPVIIDAPKDAAHSASETAPSPAKIIANAQEKAAEIVEDRVNQSGSVRQAKNARYQAIQETKATNAAFEKAADEVGSFVDKLEGNLGVMDFLLDKELTDPVEQALQASPSSAANTPATATTPDQESPEWKRQAAELYEQKRQQEQALIEGRRASTEALIQQRGSNDEQLKAGREALEARLREERAASEARMKADREAIEAKRHADQERLRAERIAMDARLKEERDARDAERRASKKLGRDD